MARIACALVFVAIGVVNVHAGTRFFFSGDGTLTLEDAHNGTKVRAHFRHADGSYDSGALEQLTHFLRSRGDEQEGEMSLRLIEQLDYLEDLVHPRHLRLASGFRSSSYNNDIRARGGKAASASLHTQGLAADVQFIGVDTRRLWLRIRKLDCCGVGYYKEGNFLHVDVGPPRFWEAATSKVDQNLSGGNARIFARTDFDRYAKIQGALVQLHSVTAFPLRVSATATMNAEVIQSAIRLGPEGDVGRDGECLVVSEGGRWLLRVVSSDQLPKHSRMRMRLTTCEPRLERTPEYFESNEIELMP